VEVPHTEFTVLPRIRVVLEFFPKKNWLALVVAYSVVSLDLCLEVKLLVN
jgi:hypothetical protein